MDGVLIIIYLVIAVVVLAGYWKVFTKAGYQGWLAIIPIVNFIVLVMIAGKEWWWILLLFIPFVNIVIAFLIYKALAERFGQGVGFAIGLFLLSPIFVPILGFGDYQYSAY